MATTVQNLLDGIKWQADLQQGGRLATADLIPEIDAAYKEAWDVIIACYEDYAVKLHTPGTFTLAGGPTGNTYQITAADFYKVKAVQVQVSGRWSDPLPTFGVNEWGSPQDGLSYIHMGDTLYFEPNESVAGWVFRLWYVYAPAELTLVGDTISDINGMVKRFIIDAVTTRAVLREEDSDVATMEKLRDRMGARLQKMAAHRNAGRGRKVQDTRRAGRFRFMTRSGVPI